MVQKEIDNLFAKICAENLIIIKHGWVGVGVALECNHLETMNQTHDSQLTRCQDWCSEKLSLEYAVNLAHSLLVPPQSSFRADIISLCTRC